MHRFFAEYGAKNEKILIYGADARHIVCVLRLKRGDEIVVCDGAATDAICVIDEACDREVSLTIRERRKNESEPELDISLFLAYTKADRLDFAAQKSTEVGCNRIYLFESARCVAKHSDNRVERLRKIIAEAAKQCGRGRIPTVEYVGDLTRALMLPRSGAKIFCYENETAPFRTQLDGNVGIICGPEGGFDEKEVVLARKTGWQTVSLGKRILRAETAPIVAITMALMNNE